MLAPAAGATSSTPLSGRGMWIWVVSSSSGGSAARIASTARAYGIRTVFIKAGDGTTRWTQFSPQLVSALHARGLKVCAWQYVYGNRPVAEAFLGAAAVRAGADCLVIDAETQYEGKYIQAQTYLTWLRKLIGVNYPLALAGLPYIDYHPGFPYSVFLGPGGAQFNAPQMYWVDIGTTVDAVYAHTYAYNRLYGRPIAPLGQVYNRPTLRQIVRFRQESIAYGATGVSWWDWQEAKPRAWHALAQRAGPLTGFTPSSATAVLQKGSHGDLVVWAQLHLVSAGYAIPVDGGFGPKTLAAVQSFQLAHGLTVDGVIGLDTWDALLSYAPAQVRWTRTGAKTSAAAARGVRSLPVPQSARLRDKREEIPLLGAGMPPR